MGHIVTTPDGEIHTIPVLWDSGKSYRTTYENALMELIRSYCGNDIYDEFNHYLTVLEETDTDEQAGIIDDLESQNDELESENNALAENLSNIAKFANLIAEESNDEGNYSMICEWANNILDLCSD